MRTAWCFKTQNDRFLHARIYIAVTTLAICAVTVNNLNSAVELRFYMYTVNVTTD